MPNDDKEKPLGPAPENVAEAVKRVTAEREDYSRQVAVLDQEYIELERTIRTEVSEAQAELAAHETNNPLATLQLAFYRLRLAARLAPLHTILSGGDDGEEPEVINPLRIAYERIREPLINAIGRLNTRLEDLELLQSRYVHPAWTRSHAQHSLQWRESTLERLPIGERYVVNAFARVADSKQLKALVKLSERGVTFMVVDHFIHRTDYPCVPDEQYVSRLTLLLDTDGNDHLVNSGCLGDYLTREEPVSLREAEMAFRAKVRNRAENLIGPSWMRADTGVSQRNYLVNTDGAVQIDPTMSRILGDSLPTADMITFVCQEKWRISPS